MMLYLYSLSIEVLIFGIRLASLFHTKAKEAIQGRKHWRTQLKLSFENNTKEVIWIHVSSLGEFEQVSPLIVQIKQQYPQYRILITFFSPSGYNARKNFEYADDVFYMPYDTLKNAKDFLNIVKPKFIFFVKYEFWLNYLNEIIKRKQEYDIKCFLISSIFRKHQPFFKWYGNIFREALNAFDMIFVQDKLSEKLLRKIGFEKNIFLTGDTRIDRVIEIAQQVFENHEIQTFCHQQKVIIGGSTWYEDEKILIPSLRELKKTMPFKIIIAPHHPDKKNIQQLSELLLQNNFSFCRYTEILKNTDADIQKYDVMIIDTIGVLNKIYRYGYIAYIGGGFRDGIHNILEPAVYGLPVIFGKKYQKFYEATELIKAQGAYSVINQNELLSALQLLLQNEQVYKASGNAVLDFVNTHKGGVSKTMGILKQYLKN